MSLDWSQSVSFGLEKEHREYGVDCLDQVFTEQETALQDEAEGAHSH